jgi:hypothetical protein
LIAPHTNKQTDASVQKQQLSIDRVYFRAKNSIADNMSANSSSSNSSAVVPASASAAAMPAAAPVAAIPEAEADVHEDGVVEQELSSEELAEAAGIGLQSIAFGVASVGTSLFTGAMVGAYLDPSRPRRGARLGTVATAGALITGAVVDAIGSAVIRAQIRAKPKLRKVFGSARLRHRFGLRKKKEDEEEEGEEEEGEGHHQGGAHRLRSSKDGEEHEGEDEQRTEEKPRHHARFFFHRKQHRHDEEEEEEEH